MHYEVIAIGNLKRSFLIEGCAFYFKRIKTFSKIEVVEIKASKNSSSEKVQTEESHHLLNKAKSYTIAMDEKGKTFNSRQLAKHITKLELQGISHLSLLIGGAHGHSSELKKQVNELWRLSDLTLPHELARLVLLEQLYRVESIRANHPYHKL